MIAVSIQKRFWSKVDKNGPVPTHRPELGPCWIWTGARNGRGYGVLKVAGRNVYVHRLSCEIEVGPILKGFEPDHLCMNRSCVRFAHLEIVTHRVNILRSRGMSGQHARRTHCSEGHPYDAENTAIKKDGSRVCKACARKNMKAWRKSNGQHFAEYHAEYRAKNRVHIREGARRRYAAAKTGPREGVINGNTKSHAR